MSLVPFARQSRCAGRAFDRKVRVGALAVAAVAAGASAQPVGASLLDPGAMVLAQASVGGNAQDLTEEEVAAAAKEIIAGRSHDGVFALRDARSDTTLNLVFDEVKLVRGMKDEGWFPNAIFHDRDAPQKKYAIDLWLAHKAGKLELVEARIQKEPQQDGTSWMMVTREPIAWWWLPTLQRASASGANRPWTLMAKVHRHIAAARVDGFFEFADAQTGETRKLELIDIERQVLRLKQDGRFAVCAAFRTVEPRGGTYYAIDFRVDGKGGTVAPERGFARAVTEQAGDEASQTSCDFKHLDGEVVQ